MRIYKRKMRNRRKSLPGRGGSTYESLKGEITLSRKWKLGWYGGMGFPSRRMKLVNMQSLDYDRSMNP